MSAIRLARGFTGRETIVKFEGCYHGHSDSLLIKAGSGALTLGVPTSPGVPADLARHTLLHDGSPNADESCPDWSMWLAARGIKGVDGTRGPRFNQSSLVIEAAMGGRGVALAKGTLAQDDLDAGRLVAPLQIATAVDFAYYVVHPKAKGRLPQVKAFVSWIIAEAAAHEAALATLDNGAGI